MHKLFIAKNYGVFAGISALLIAGAGFIFGITHNFHHWFPEAIEYENVKVAIAISDLVYGTNKGYIADTRVYDSLRKDGVTIEKKYLELLNEVYPENMRNADLLNKAFKNASNLSINTKDRPNTLVSWLKPVEPNDLGMVEFYKISFYLFGIEIQAFYKMYYLIYVVSILVFFMTFWRNLTAMVVMSLLVCGNFLAQLYLYSGTTALELFNLATPYNQRFISVLGLVSAFHVTLFLWKPSLINRKNFLLFIIQVFIVLFVSTFRRSAIWEFNWALTFPFIFLIFFVLRVWLPKYFKSLIPDPINFLKTKALSRPFLIAVFCLFFLGVFQSARTNPLYSFSDEFLPQHMFWHSAYLGLTTHPKWIDKYGKNYTEPTGGDRLPMEAADQFLMQEYGIPKEYLISQVWGFKYRTTERVIREAYFNFIKKDPKFFIETIFIYKPIMLAKNFYMWNKVMIKNAPIWCITLAFFELLFLILLVIKNTDDYSISLNSASFLLLVGSIWAAAPAIVVFPSGGVMSDQSIMYLTLLAVLLLIAISYIKNKIKFRPAKFQSHL